MFFVIHLWQAGASQPSRSFERNLYNGRRRTYTRRTSCKYACASLNALLFIRNLTTSKFLHIFTHGASR